MTISASWGTAGRPLVGVMATVHSTVQALSGLLLDMIESDILTERNSLVSIFVGMLVSFLSYIIIAALGSGRRTKDYDLTS